MRIAPARASFRATVASAAGTKSRRIFDPAVVLIPRVQMLSFNVIGIPRSGRFRLIDLAIPARLRENSFSARRAAASACSAVTV